MPFLKAGFNKTFSETTNLNKCINEILTLEYGEVSTVRRLQAAHALFTALEFTADPIEIMNEQFKILVSHLFISFIKFKILMDPSLLHFKNEIKLLIRQISILVCE